MSKKRLEDFREFIDFMYESLDIEDHQRFVAISEFMIESGWFKWICRYAKEQAERVQELEDELNYYKMATESYVDMEEQNIRYRGAIKRAIGKFNYDYHQEGMAELLKVVEED